MGAGEKHTQRRLGHAHGKLASKIVLASCVVGLDSILFTELVKKQLSSYKLLEPTLTFWMRMQSHSGSIHSPQRMRKIIMNEWKKSVKFHLGWKLMR